jgi:hypothetical protein
MLIKFDYANSENYVLLTIKVNERSRFKDDVMINVLNLRAGYVLYIGRYQDEIIILD